MCTPGSPSDGMQAVAAQSIRVFIDVGTVGAPLAAEASAYLGRIWGRTVETSEGAPDGSADLSIWVSSLEAARTALGTDLTQGYVIRRVDDAGKARVIIFSPTPGDAVAGFYAFVEMLGARFFHPKDEFVPELGGVFLPPNLDVTRRPMTPVRGIHLHLLHPTEYLKPFDVAGPENLEDAKKFIDWLVKTGQNHVQWWILDTMDFPTWKPHASAIIEHAHARGLTVGAEVMLWAGSSLQNGYELISDRENWEQEMMDQVDFLLELQWDEVEVNLGEFTGLAPESLLTWLNTTLAYLQMQRPGIHFSVVNHVGNYENLYVDFRGMEDVFFYHLPGYADAGLINAVHTVFWYDLYREQGMYEHPNFHMHRDFILRQLPQRKVRYFPESAYWVTADVDVPLFLPEFVHSRWTDIHNLDADIRASGLPQLDGHIMFSSGHEWGYWMVDYLSARALWQAEIEFPTLLSHVTAIHGGCAPVLAEALTTFTALQTEFLFDRTLIAYLSGEDVHDDLGAQAGFLTHPRRIQYEELAELDAAGLEAFERDVFGGLDEFVGRLSKDVRPRAEAACALMDEARRAWCAEIVDGMEIVELRARHARTLSTAVVQALKDSRSDWEGVLRQAQEIRTQAEAVVHRRAQHYRFDLDTLTTAYENVTIYEFGYLKQAHDMCFWRRQEQQAEYVIRNGVAPNVLDIPTCMQ